MSSGEDWSESRANGTETLSGKYRDLPHRSANEILRSHSNFAVKLSETAVEFIQKLAGVEEQHSQQLHSVVKTYKKKTAESLKKDPIMAGTGYFKAWEALLEESDRQARSHTDLSQRLITSVSQQLNELTNRKKNLMKKWYVFRETYMNRLDKTEDGVQKVFRDYQDQWTRYAEHLEKKEGSAKNSMVLQSYNAHNDYVLSRTSFNCLHEEFYNKQVYDMLDELQAIQEDLVKGFRHCVKSRVEIQQDKIKDTLKHLHSLMETVTAIKPPDDIAHFVRGQNIQVKTYPPPKADHRSPELPPPKTPEAAPVDLPSLPSSLQLVDLTQAPLGHLQEEFKKKEFEVSSSLDQLHKEYQSVKTLLDSYRENPALGDPNSLVEELLQIRNKVRMRESDLAMVKGKRALFNVFSAEPQDGDMYSLLDNGPSSSSRPLKTSDVLVVGRSHEFVEDEKKFRIPVKCSYCDGVVQAPISRGVKCKICKFTVHVKCQSYIAYCSGPPPPKSAGKSGDNHVHPVRYSNSPRVGPKKNKRFSWMQGGKKGSSETTETVEGADYDDPIDDLYEPPPSPPPRPMDKSRLVESPTAAPSPPRRNASLDPKGNGREEELGHYSFEDSDRFKYCVVLYDYSKVNTNDLEVQAGDVVEIVNTSSSDWWKGTRRGKSGYFPASYVQLVSQGDVVMRAIYEFSASSSEETSLEEGQIVVMTRRDGDGWLFGRSGDSEGLFPENYVERLQVV